ncbi:MAG: HNH endonuclease, partial [Candidatus Nanopelagicales bacterium]
YTVAVSTELRSIYSAETPLEARYIERSTRQRLHQPMFRARVMDAYVERCAICALGHATLLDAAHITPDSDVRSVQEVSNGLALCKIHHAAFDANIVGIRPDYVVQVATDLLAEIDGPMLKHGLQEFHGAGLRQLPRRRREQPNRDRLDARYTEFLAAS